MGHPWPCAANPASCRVTHAPKPAFGQRGLTGRLRSRSKARAQRPTGRLECGEATARATAKSEAGTVKCESWLACDGINWVYLMHRGVCIAGKPAPTEKQSFISFRFGFRSGSCLCFQHSSRPGGRCAFAFDFDLTAPISPRPNAGIAERVNRQDAGLAAPGHGWPVAAARGAMPE
ncbi:hypothetical protein SAMN05216237_5927 [Pseudomonas yamanorum]|nr:hypothetical protein SAMN05216237_5927 [Pseudomonas yamanorum]